MPMLSLSVIMRSTAGMPAATLLFLAVCFEAARSQTVEISSDPASNVQSGKFIEVTSPGDFEALTPLDDTFYQRTMGAPSGSLDNDEEKWIDRITITMFFPVGKAEIVTVRSGEFRRDFKSSSIETSGLLPCPESPLQFPVECLIDQWIFKADEVKFDVCTKSWTLLLEGVTCLTCSTCLIERPVHSLR